MSRVTEEKSNLAFLEREGAFSRTPYQMERGFMALLEKGDTESISPLIDSGLLFANNAVGNLSANDVRQAQYTAVTFMTLATRVAIEAGMPELEAFSMSDEFILKIDVMSDADEIIFELSRMVLYLTKRIADCRKGKTRAVNRCISYISAHLHERLSLSELARYCGVSEGNLSRRFHSETGTTLKSYITKAKLEEATALMDTGGLSSAEAANMLGFSSQSYFIECYKREYGVTPGKYRHDVKRVR